MDTQNSEIGMKPGSEFDELSLAELDLVSAGSAGGIVITHGGGNSNVAKGPLSEA
jgi:hypothetical protein